MGRTELPGAGPVHLISGVLARDDGGLFPRVTALLHRRGVRVVSVQWRAARQPRPGGFEIVVGCSEQQARVLAGLGSVVGVVQPALRVHVPHG